jgi:hypothetical protein
LVPRPSGNPPKRECWNTSAGAFNKVFQFLAHLSRSTPSHTDLLKEKEQIRLLMYLLVLQNSFHNGTNLPPKRKGRWKRAPSVLPVAKIIQDLQEADQPQPGAQERSRRSRTSFVEFSMYKREHENFAKLSPNI